MREWMNLVESHATLSEGVERVAVWSGATISVHHNPTRDAFKQLVAKCKLLRGILSPNGQDIWVWEAGAAVHTNIIQELGIPFDCVYYKTDEWTGPALDYYSPKPALERLTPESEIERRRRG